MGLITNAKRYIEAVRELFPKGSFFDNEFSNNESDLSKLSEVKGKEIYNFKKNIEALWKEARLETCSEKTISDYERIYALKKRDDLTLSERKQIIKNKRTEVLNIDFVKSTASLFNATIRELKYPHRPAIFGESRFGKTRIFDLKVFNVIYIYARIVDEDKLEAFENETKKMMMNARFGKTKCGITRLLNFRVFNFEYVHSQVVESQKKEEFEKAIINIMLANQIIYFKYKGELKLCLCIQKMKS